MTTGTMQHRTRKYLFVAAIVFALAAGFGPGSRAEEPRRGGTMTVLSISDINTLNPAIASGAQVMMPGAQLFAGLVEYGADWKPIPYLAESWDVSKDGLTYTFHLVRNAVFHDGTPITSADVAFSIDVVKNNHPFGPGMMGNVVAVDTPDPLTAVIRLSKPTPALLPALSPHFSPILPKHVFSTAPIRTHPRNNSPIGSGPFKFVEYKPGEYLVLERFDKFFRPGRPYLDKLVFTIMKDKGAQALAVARGDINYNPFPPFGIADIVRLKKDPKIVATDKANAGIGWLVWLEFNLRNAPFTDARVRQAISYAIDRKFIREKLQSGISKVATGPIVTASPFYNAAVDPYDLDLARANALLDEAGYKRNAQGIRFSARLDWYPSNQDYYQTVAEYLRPQLKKIGIDVQLRPSPDYSTWAQRISNWDFDIDVSSAYNYGDPVIGVHRTYLSSNIRKGVPYSNTEGYNNPKVDELLNAAAAEIDPAKRQVFYHAFQKIVNTEVPLAFLFEVPVVTMYDKNLKNIPLGIWGGLNPYDEVYWAIPHK